MLVCIRIDSENVKCMLITSGSTNIHTLVTDGQLYLCYSNGGKNVSIDMKCKSESTDLPVWVVIPMFRVVIAGDLSFFATSSGRDGHSHVRCPYCDLTSSSWQPNNHSTGIPMTLELLEYYAQQHHSNPKSDTKGVVMSPLIKIDPSRYIIPILHLLIGLVNKGWVSMCQFIDKFVESMAG